MVRFKCIVMKIPLLPILLMIVLFSGANFYVIYRLWQMMPATIIGRALLLIAGIVVCAAPFLAIILGDRFPLEITSLLYKAGTSWLVVFLYLLMFFVLLDLFRLTHLWAIDKYVFGNWTSFGILVVAITTVMSVGYVRYTHKAKVELSIDIDKPIRSGNPLKIVAISDLHLGYSIGRNEFERWVKLINRENPDIVLIAGDITDNSVRPLYEERMEEVFGQIRSKYGIYTIPGNHEYIADAKKAFSFYEKAGLTLLRDSVVLVDNSFYVVGRDDRSNPNRQPLDQLMAGLDRSKPIILLDHQPYNLEEAEQNGIDLQLSGHTHEGQIWPVSLITKSLFELPHGYIQKGNTHIYVSSGIGIWGGKFRIGTQSEYVVIDMKTK